MRMCEWEGCEDNVEGLFQTWSEDGGTLTYKDEGQVIRHQHMSSEHARKIASGSRLTLEGKQTARDLKEAIWGLLPEDDPRYDVLKITSGKLAHLVAKESNQALRALELILDIVNDNKRATRKPLHGETCPLCELIVGDRLTVNISDAMVERYAINLEE